MKQEKLVICEPEKAFRFLLRFNFKTTPHIIVGWATTLEESLETVDEIDRNEIDCTTMILDGHFSDECNDAEDAHLIVNEVRARNLGISLISFCIDPLKTAYGVDVDYEVVKPDIVKLMQTVDSCKH